MRFLPGVLHHVLVSERWVGFYAHVLSQEVIYYTSCSNRVEILVNVKHALQSDNVIRPAQGSPTMT